MQDEATKEFDTTQARYSTVRLRVYFLIFLSFLLPLFFIIFFAASSSSTFYMIAFLAALCGSGAGFVLLQRWEARVRSSVASYLGRRAQTLGVSAQQEDYKAKYEEVSLEMDQKLEQMRVAYLEYEDLRKEYARLEEDYQNFHKEVKAQMQHKDGLVAEYQQTIAEQRKVLEKKQRYIAGLENKVRDLMFEIRSLLHLEQASADNLPLEKSGQTLEEYYLPKQKTAYDLSMQLQCFVKMATDFTGADHLGYVGGAQPRFLGDNSFAIDQRRLFDQFREETVGILFVFSEGRLLFVNNYVKTLLGYGPEKFIKDLPHLVQRGWEAWKAQFSKPTADIQVEIRTKSGNVHPFLCQMKQVDKGPFSGQIIGLLSPLASEPLQK